MNFNLMDLVTEFRTFPFPIFDAGLEVVQRFSPPALLLSDAVALAMEDIQTR